MTRYCAQVPFELRKAIERGVVDVGRGVDGLVAALAEVQHGVVARAQLLELGVGAKAIAARVRARRLHPVNRGVYLVGHRAAPRLAAEMAAVLACGRGAVISHHSAAILWRLLRVAAGLPIEVTVIGRSAPDRPGLRVQTTSLLAPADVRRVERIPITSPARTLLDLAAAAPTATLEQALAEAGARHLVRRSQLEEQLRRNRGRPGTAALRAVLESDRGPALTRSAAERRLLRLIRAAQLPAPETNVMLGGWEVDFVWCEQRLVVEVDGYQFHSSRRAFERDRRRDAELGNRGFRVVRITWRQLIGEPEAVIACISTALATS